MAVGSVISFCILTIQTQPWFCSQCIQWLLCLTKIAQQLIHILVNLNCWCQAELCCLKYLYFLKNMLKSYRSEKDFFLLCSLSAGNPQPPLTEKCLHPIPKTNQMRNSHFLGVLLICVTLELSWNKTIYRCNSFILHALVKATKTYFSCSLSSSLPFGL